MNDIIDTGMAGKKNIEKYMQTLLPLFFPS